MPPFIAHHGLLQLLHHGIDSWIVLRWWHDIITSASSTNTASTFHLLGLLFDRPVAFLDAAAAHFLRKLP